jgi:mRNA guanylyltransferase
MGKTPEIPGYLAPPDVAHSLQREVAQLLARPPNSLSFPGSQPVSFSRKHIEENLFGEE